MDLEGFGFVLPHWLYWGWLALMPLVMIWWSYHKEGKRIFKLRVIDDSAEMLHLQDQDDPVVHRHVSGGIVARIIDWISEHTGMFVAFWSINAVCMYFYEVLMRYVFNMPTIWVHEASFLLFGMQYLLAGAFGLLEGSHVRVDILYVRFSEKARVALDIFTSTFFFIFALALIVTSWRFFSDSLAMNERTVETWQIQYWPVKLMMLVGAILLLLAGISKLLKDLQLLRMLDRESRA
jgi:TRAP-type mannitol/chloroaromatic compound transport system permease small subunit